MNTILNTHNCQSEDYVAFHSEAARQGLSYKVTKWGTICVSNGTKVQHSNWAKALRLLRGE
jgi:hypothetical protein